MPRGAEPSDKQVPPGAASASGYRAGEVLVGKYELLRTLGQGGMATVWVVQNLILDAQFALKIRNDDGDAHAAERMLREARSLARIEHPAIIRVLDYGLTNRGDPFLVMELLSGHSLRRHLLAEGPFTPVEAVRLLLPLAEGLAAAHSHGVVHRDLKPDNVICVEEEAGRLQPKLIDFGIARQLDQAAMRLTQSGTVLGSPEYMSPEQASGLPDIDHKTDIWSFCVVLFELVTGTTPFYRGGEIAPVLDAIIEAPLPPLNAYGVDDPELSSILVRGLQKHRSGRWNDMHSLGVALARWLVRQGVEDDICSHSVRAVWLGMRSSAPPVALLTRPDAERARLAALSEEYEVPKKSAFAAAFGISAAVLAVALIAVGGVYSARAIRAQAPPATQPPEAVTEPTKAQRSESIRLAPAVSPPAEAAASAREEVPKAAEEKPPVSPPASASTESSASPPMAKTKTKTRAKERSAPLDQKRIQEALRPSSPRETRPTETPLPDVKPPPVFDQPQSDNPYDEAESPLGGAPERPTPGSDNPYVDPD